MIKKLKVLFGSVWIKDKEYRGGDILASPPLSEEEWKEVIRIYNKYPYFFEVLEKEKKEKKKDVLHNE